MAQTGSGGVDIEKLAAVASIVGAGVGISTARGAKKTAEHAKKRATGRAMELEEEAATETRLGKETARKDRMRRLQGVARNLNLFAATPELAGAARKTLTGQ